MMGAVGFGNTRNPSNTSRPIWVHKEALGVVQIHNPLGNGVKSYLSPTVMGSPSFFRCRWCSNCILSATVMGETERDLDSGDIGGFSDISSL